MTGKKINKSSLINSALHRAIRDIGDEISCYGHTSWADPESGFHDQVMHLKNLQHQMKLLLDKRLGKA